MISISVVFGKNLTALRKLSGFSTQAALADAIDMDLKTVNRIENGHYLPRAETISQIAGVLKIDERLLFIDPEFKPDVTPEQALEVLRNFVMGHK